MRKNSEGIFIIFFPWSMSCKASKNPNTVAAKKDPTGFHPPDILAAKAINPLPFVIPSVNAVEFSIAKNAPANPEVKPEIMTAKYLILTTDTPKVSRARGCSPAALTKAHHGPDIARCDGKPARNL